MPKSVKVFTVDHELDTQTPETGLLAAILLRAMLDIRTGNQIAHREADIWFHHQGEDAFSFYWVCAHLGLQPLATRTLAYNMKFNPQRVKT